MVRVDGFRDGRSDRNQKFDPRDPQRKEVKETAGTDKEAD